MTASRSQLASQTGRKSLESTVARFPLKPWSEAPLPNMAALQALRRSTGLVILTNVKSTVFDFRCPRFQTFAKVLLQFADILMN
jgi:hypothetical protein